MKFLQCINKTLNSKKTSFHFLKNRIKNKQMHGDDFEFILKKNLYRHLFTHN